MGTRGLVGGQGLSLVFVGAGVWIVGREGKGGMETLNC